jgi:MFS family permease
VRRFTSDRTGNPLAHPQLKPLLYLICVLADFSGFVVVFAVSRGLAENDAEMWYLGLAGGAFAGSSGIANVLSGWASHRFDSRSVFVSGAIIVATAVAVCGLGDTASSWFLLRYCLLGVGLGTVYPTLIGWLNRDQDAHANRRGVSRTLILFCVSWNVGMMSGQVTSGALFSLSPQLAYGVAFAVAILNVLLAIIAARLVSHSLRRRWSTTEHLSDDEPHPIANAVALEIAGRFKQQSWVANLGGTFGGSLIFHLLPELAVSIGVPADDHGGLLFYWRSVVIATLLVLHFSEFWHYRVSTSVASQLLGVLGLLIIAQAQSATVLFIGLTLHGQLAGYNYFSGLFYSTAGSSQDRRTMAAGIHEATLAIGMSSGTVLGGYLGTQIGPRSPWFMAATVLMVLVAIQLFAWWRWNRLTRSSMIAVDGESTCEQETQV